METIVITDYTCPPGYVKCADGIQCVNEWTICRGETDCADDMGQMMIRIYVEVN